MARKTASRQKTATPSSEPLAQAVVDSAQKIWLAGLGAFARARNEGQGMFDALVEQGKGLRSRAREAADQALTAARAQADATFGQAQGQWDKLEQVFEDRVSRSLNRLGVMTSRDVEALARQVEELNETVRALMKAPATPRAARSSGARAGSTRKKAAKRKAGR
jgi:poly(hydroxyalkanoate) granule-associated protein